MDDDFVLALQLQLSLIEEDEAGRCHLGRRDADWAFAVKDHKRELTDRRNALLAARLAEFGSVDDVMRDAGSASEPGERRKSVEADIRTRVDAPLSSLTRLFAGGLNEDFSTDRNVKEAVEVERDEESLEEKALHGYRTPITGKASLIAGLLPCSGRLSFSGLGSVTGPLTDPAPPPPSTRPAPPPDPLGVTSTIAVCVSCVDMKRTYAVPCGHAYCRACIIEVYQTCLRDRSFAPARCCKALFDAAWATAFLTGEDLSKYEDFTKVVVVQRDPEFERVVIASGSKLCRQCGAGINRNHGCAHMTCVCGYQFCWTCGAGWVPRGCSCELFTEAELDRIIRDVAPLAPLRIQRRVREEYRRHDQHVHVWNRIDIGPRGRYKRGIGDAKGAW
ncbi:hypothetical protein HK101_009879 [Irineochytrium annulatum]|nr:hypothetical protein HK101_009879 [Irineochytrium annulatum]